MDATIEKRRECIPGGVLRVLLTGGVV